MSEITTNRWRGIAIVSLAVAVSGAVMAQTSLHDLSKDANQWVIPAGNYAGHRNSTLKEITPDNVKHLHVAWTMSTGSLRGHEGQPLVIGDKMYVESSFPNFVYAVSLKEPGRIIWKFAPQQDKFAPSVACCDVVNRGVAYSNGVIYANALDGFLYALDANTGAVKWKMQNADPKLGQTQTMAPLVVGNVVLTGVSGAEYGVHGYVTGNDATTGKQLWRAFSTGPDDQLLFEIGRASCRERVFVGV